MPDFISTPSSNILPVWDSFEAVFFVLSGLIIGIVFSRLFPSIWRTLRRRFRPYGRFVANDISWQRTFDLNLDLLPVDKKISAIQEPKDIQKKFPITQSFVIARDYVQRGELRHAVKMYGEILTSDMANTSNINRALFELAQVYSLLALYPRAFDTAFEILKRRTRDECILNFILHVLTVYIDEIKLIKTYRVFNGRMGHKQRTQMAHLFCQYAEHRIKSKHNHKKIIELIRFALRVDNNFTHAKFLLWQMGRQTLRYKKNLDVKAKWMAFGAELEAWVHLSENTGLSSRAGASHILSMLIEIIPLDQKFEALDAMQNEFLEVIDFKKLLASQQKIILESILSSIILLRDMKTQITEQDCLLFLEKICNGIQILDCTVFVNGMINPEVLKIGVLTHFCSTCQSLFANFDWSCGVCHLPEPLKVRVPLFKEYCIDAKKEKHHKNNSN